MSCMSIRKLSKSLSNHKLVYIWGCITQNVHYMCNINYNHSFVRWWLLALPFAMCFRDSTSAIMIISNHFVQGNAIDAYCNLLSSFQFLQSFYYQLKDALWICVDAVLKYIQIVVGGWRKCTFCIVQVYVPEMIQKICVVFVSHSKDLRTFFHVWIIIIINKSHKRCGMQIRFLHVRCASNSIQG